MLSTLQIIMLVVFIVGGLILGVMGLFACFWYAKDIFTPTRKSVLMSGMYWILANLSIIIPIVAISENDHLSLTFTGMYNAIIIFGCMGGLSVSPIIVYVIVGYVYAVSREKKK